MPEPNPPQDELDRHSGLGLLLVLLALYLGAHLALRLIISDSVDVDESDVVLFTQSLEWGYYEQPPLYSWGVWPFAKLFGVSIFTITLFRLVVLGAIHVLLYFTTLRLTRDRTAALLAALAPLLVPTLAWNAIYYLTHTLLACALAVATFHALLRVHDEGRTRDYLLLGLVVGLGGISKYNFALLAAALLVAGLSVRSFRARLLDPRIVLSIGIAAAVVAPHGLWLLRNWEAVRQGVAYKTSSPQTGALSGLTNLAINVVIILLPLVPLFIFCFPQVLRRRERSPGCILLGRYFFAIAAVLVAQIVLGSVSRFHERWLQPLLVIVPAYLFALLPTASLESRRIRRFAAGLTVCAIGFLTVRGAQLWTGGLDRGRYPLQMALEVPGAQLREAGFAKATIVAHEREIAGNLRLLFPHARVLCSAQPHYVPPPLAEDGLVFLVWNVQSGLGANPPPSLVEFARGAHVWPSDANGPVWVVALPAEKPGRPTNYLLVASVARTPGIAQIESSPQVSVTTR